MVDEFYDQFEKGTSNRAAGGRNWNDKVGNVKKENVVALYDQG